MALYVYSWEYKNKHIFLNADNVMLLAEDKKS